MLKKQAKSAIPLQPYLRTDPTEGDSATHTKMTAALKAPQKILFVERPTAALQKEEITEYRQEITAQLLQIKSMVSGFTRFLPRLLN